jgi:hypothetical protein
MSSPDTPSVVTVLMLEAVVFEDDTIAGLPADHLNEPLQHLLAGRKRAVAYFFYKDRRQHRRTHPRAFSRNTGRIVDAVWRGKVPFRGVARVLRARFEGVRYGLAPLSDV